MLTVNYVLDFLKLIVCFFPGFVRYSSQKAEKYFDHRMRYINTINSKKYPCGSCTSVFGHKNSLMTHLRYECGQPPRFKCPYCEFISKKTSNVQQHIRRKHLGFKVYVHDIYNLQKRS